MKNKFIDILRYKFDKVMSKGTISLIGILFLVTFSVVIIAGILLVIIGGERSLAISVWKSVMHVIDPGTITADEPDRPIFLILMSVVTLCGIFITSILISIITTGFKKRLDMLQQGTGRVIEKDHTLILGYNENTYTIISELAKAYENQKKGCVVVLSDRDIEDVRGTILSRLPKNRNIEIIYRRGDISDPYMLKQCSIDTAKSVVLSIQDDFTVIKAMLAINTYFQSITNFNKNIHFVTSLNDATNYDAVLIAGDTYIEAIQSDDIISRIIAQVIRQPGLSNVLIELFNYESNEIYFESFPELINHNFGDCITMFNKAVVLGIEREGKVILNPNNDLTIEIDDKFIILAQDDGITKSNKKRRDFTNVGNIVSTEFKEDDFEHILILGVNSLLKSTLLELDTYFVKGKKVIVADIEENLKKVNFENELQNISLTKIEGDITKRENIKELLKHDIDHVLLLSSDEMNPDDSDSKTLLKLIHLRDLEEKTTKKFSITSEMKNTKNEKLAQVARVNDLVISNNIINLLLTQISQNRNLSYVFKELLSSQGAEIYLKRLTNYVKPDIEVDFYEVSEIVKGHNEIALGYKKQLADTYKIITNPTKEEKIIFSKDDYLIILSRN